MKALIIKNDGRGTEKSFSSTLDLGSIVIYGRSPEQVKTLMADAIARKLEDVFSLDMEKTIVRTEIDVGLDILDKNQQG